MEKVKTITSKYNNKYIYKTSIFKYCINKFVIRFRKKRKKLKLLRCKISFKFWKISYKMLNKIKNYIASK